MAKIIFNGKTYDTPDEMSAADRAAFEQIAVMFGDKNGNGIPDFLEGDILKNVSTAYTNIVNINGQAFNDMNEMPEEMRAKVQGAFQKMSELGLVPPASTATPGQVSSVSIGQSSPQFISTPPITSQSYPPTIQEGNRPGTLQWVLLVLIVLLCVMAGVAGALYFYLR